jgi:hypothetical protein
MFGTAKKSDSPVTISPPEQDHQKAKSRPPAMRALFVLKLRVLGPAARDVLLVAPSIRMNLKWPPDEADGVTTARDRRSTVGSRCLLTVQYGGCALLAASEPIAAQRTRTVRRELSPPSSISAAHRPSSDHPCSAMATAPGTCGIGLLLREGARTRDLGGPESTESFTEAVAALVAQRLASQKQASPDSNSPV